MSTKQIALDALRQLLSVTDCGFSVRYDTEKAITALEADIAQAVEPVAWANPIILLQDDDDEKEGWRAMVLSHGTADFRLPLYTTPPEPEVNAELLAALKRCKFDSLNMSLADAAFCRAAYLKATS